MCDPRPPFVVLVNSDFTECTLSTQINLLTNPGLGLDTNGNQMTTIAVLNHMTWEEANTLKTAISIKLKEIRR